MRIGEILSGDCHEFRPSAPARSHCQNSPTAGIKERAPLIGVKSVAKFSSAENGFRTGPELPPPRRSSQSSKQWCPAEANAYRCRRGFHAALPRPPRSGSSLANPWSLCDCLRACRFERKELRAQSTPGHRSRPQRASMMADAEGRLAPPQRYSSNTTNAKLPTGSHNTHSGSISVKEHRPAQPRSRNERP